MQFRNTLIALIVLLIIGGYAFVNYYFSKPEAAKTAYDIKAEDIAKVDLKYPDREILIERKPGEPWNIVKPIGVKADQTTANNLARAIADAQITKTVEEKPADIAPFGLDKPQVIITVTTTKGKTLPALVVGKVTPVGFSAYIKYSDKPQVMMTSSAFPSGMNKTVDQMRDKELMAFKVDDVNKITIARDNGTVMEIDRDGDKWKIVKPANYAGDPTQVRQVLTTLADAKVADFISDAPRDVSQYGLEKPHLTVTVALGNKGEQESLLFGFKEKQAGKDGIYVRRGERAPVYTVAPWVMSGIDKSIFDLRDKMVLNVDPAKVETVTVNSSGKTFTLKRAPGGKWDLVESGATTPADVAGVERFLDQIRDLKGNTIVMDPIKSPEMFGMERAPISVSLADAAGKRIGQLKLSKIELQKPAEEGSTEAAPQTRTEYYADSSASTALFTIDDFTFSQLNKTADQFRSKTPPPPMPSSAATVQASIAPMALVSPRPRGTPTTTARPTGAPTPTARPTLAPTPTARPTAKPTPTARPTSAPTMSPSPRPTAAPTTPPTARPTPSPRPTAVPTKAPTARPTPSPIPTLEPTAEPTY
jgi:hypothetical protein